MTGLNASNLNSGTVPNGRITGSYSGFTDISGSGDVQFTTFKGVNRGSATNPVYTFGPDTDTGMYSNAANNLSFTVGGTERLRIGAGGNINAINGAIFDGDGSGLTSLNASQLTSGTVNNNRISGDYNNFINITASGKTTSDNFTASGDSYYGGGTRIILAPNESTGTRVYIRPAGGSNTDIQTYWDGGGNAWFSSNISITGIFNGNGSGITTLNASQLTSGTVNSARVSGDYSNITGVGALSSGNITSGFGNINIGSNTFTGNGSGLTNLNADNIVDNNNARDFVRSQVAKTVLGSLGSYAMLGRRGGTLSVTPGDTVSGSSLRYAGIVESGSGDVEVHISGGTPPGVWMCVGFLDSWTNAAALFVRIS